MFKSFLISALLFIFSGNISANIEVAFIEGAPKDQFIFNNTSKCDLQDVALKIDLSESEGLLIFDTSSQGKGVEVFQPFEVSKGQIRLASVENVNDGDTQLSLHIETMQANDYVSFTIDVDDTLVESELGNIRVTGTEITNAFVSIDVAGKNTLKAQFDNNGKALLVMSKCTS